MNFILVIEQLTPTFTMSAMFRNVLRPKEYAVAILETGLL